MATDSGTNTALTTTSVELEALADAVIDVAITTGTHVQAKAGSVVVGGSAEVHPVTTVTGPCFELELYNITTGARLFWHDLVLLEDQELVIDHRSRTATVDGSPISTSGIEGTFWSFLPGTNLVSAGASEAPTGFTISIAYAEAYF